MLNVERCLSCNFIGPEAINKQTKNGVKLFRSRENINILDPHTSNVIIRQTIQPFEYSVNCSTTTGAVTQRYAPLSSRNLLADLLL